MDVGDDVGFLVRGLVDGAVPGRMGREREGERSNCEKRLKFSSESAAWLARASSRRLSPPVSVLL